MTFIQSGFNFLSPFLSKDNIAHQGICRAKIAAGFNSADYISMSKRIAVFLVQNAEKRLNFLKIWQYSLSIHGYLLIVRNTR